jgi:3-methyladenine DNA glycosylase AlkD
MTAEEFVDALRGHRSPAELPVIEKRLAPGDTAVTAPLWFVRRGGDDDLATVFAVAALLAADPDPVVHKAVGIALKHAGARDPRAVGEFVEQHAAAMPRAVLRSAREKLGPATRPTSRGTS